MTGPPRARHQALSSHHHQREPHLNDDDDDNDAFAAANGLLVTNNAADRMMNKAPTSRFTRAKATAATATTTDGPAAHRHQRRQASSKSGATEDEQEEEKKEVEHLERASSTARRRDAVGASATGGSSNVGNLPDDDYGEEEEAAIPRLARSKQKVAAAVRSSETDTTGAEARERAGRSKRRKVSSETLHVAAPAMQPESMASSGVKEGATSTSTTADSFCPVCSNLRPSSSSSSSSSSDVPTRCAQCGTAFQQDDVGASILSASRRKNMKESERTAAGQNDTPAGTTDRTVATTRSGGAKVQPTRSSKRLRERLKRSAKPPRESDVVEPTRTSPRIKKTRAKVDQEEEPSRALPRNACGAPQPSNVRANQRLHYRDIEVDQCEACLQPFALYYLAKHRSTLHGLRVNEHGCPHCDLIYLSAESRLEHIKKSHRGVVSSSLQSDRRDYSKIKRHVYACPTCNDWYSWSGLVRHLRIGHGQTLDAVRSKVFCMCPFCPWSDHDASQFRFRSDEELRAHVASKHKGFQLLDDYHRSSLQQVATKQTSSKFVESTRKRKNVSEASFFKSSEASLDDDDEEEEDETSDDDTSAAKKLDHRGLVSDYLYGDYLPMTFGNSLHSSLAAVEEQLDELDDVYTKNANDEEYAAETKLYNRGLRTRQPKAEAERGEKERHRQEVERRMIEHEYQNRNKKRSRIDIEYEEFLTRPVKFLTRRQSARHSACEFGDNCPICTSAEDADDDDVPDGGTIEAPSFAMKDVKDTQTHASDDDDEEEKTGNRRVRRRGARSGQVHRSVTMLRELQHSLRFVAEYNKGF